MDWEDVWEAPLRRIPIDSDFEEGKDIYDSYEYNYGQCWSKNGDSDAMWRIYSPNKDGIMLQTTVKRLVDSINLDDSLIAPVIYFNDLQEGLSELDEKPYEAHLAGALLKRKAFIHEEEVRLLLMPSGNGDKMYYEVDVETNILIENIILDPRCEKWYLDTIIKYCKRSELNAIPYKSDLYEDNIYEKNKFKIVIREALDEEPYF